MKKSFLKEYFSIPNIMGYFRMVLALLFLVLFYNSLQGGIYWPVILVIVLSGITDFFDGKIARKFDMVTDWGKMLDPIADKVTIGVIIISLSLKYKIVIMLVAFYVIKEGFMALAEIISIRKGHKVQGAMWYGKFCTFATYVILIVLLLVPKMPLIAVNILVISNLIVMIFTLGEYINYFRKMWQKK